MSVITPLRGVRLILTSAALLVLVGGSTADSAGPQASHTIHTLRTGLISVNAAHERISLSVFNDTKIDAPVTATICGSNQLPCPVTKSTTLKAGTGLVISFDPKTTARLRGTVQVTLPGSVIGCNGFPTSLELDTVASDGPHARVIVDSFTHEDTPAP